MLVRTAVGIICVPLVLLLIFAAPPWALAVFFALIGVIAVPELFRAAGMAGERTAQAACAVSAAAVPVWAYFEYPLVWAALWLLLMTVFFFALSMRKKKGFGFGSVAISLFSAVLLPLFLSFVIAVNAGENGSHLVFFPFMTAWVSDTAAYFTGSLLGKRKLCPAISPKKTVEGAAGAVILNAAAGAAYAFVLRSYFGLDASYLVMAGVAAAGSAAGQFGDLIFSWIKREFEVKDFGRLLPGHGGVLDRFDSLFLVAPFVYAMTRLLPFIG